MLSPSKLFFGTPDPEPSLDEKPFLSGGDGLDLWQDSDDADERTDVPADPHERSAEQSLEASLNESEEERRSPIGPGALGVSDREQRAIARAAMASHVVGQQRPFTSGPPPGLPLIDQGGCLTMFGTDELRSPQLVKPVLDCGVAADDKDSDDDEEDADDENSHLGDIRQGYLDVNGALRYSDLPSIGSANHFSGNCDRCCFHPKGRCLNGFNCQHCHFDHEKRKRKNKKKNKSKQLSSLTCDESMEMLSVSVDGSSMPVSPDAPFGQGMLPQAEYSVSASTTPQHAASAGFLAQQTAYYTGTDAASRSTGPAVAPGLATDKWYQAPVSASPSQAPVPQLQESFATAPPPGYEFPGQLTGGPGQTLLGPADSGFGSRVEMEPRFSGEQDRREEYLRQLEAENRYLRTCLVQYLGPNAPALSLLPPPPGGPQQNFFRAAEGHTMQGQPDDPTGGPALAFGPCPPPPPGVPAPMPPGVSIPQQPLASHGLSPSAPPFWPAWQETTELLEGASCYDVPPHHPSILEQVPLRQDADGHVVSTSSVAQPFTGDTA